MPPSPDVLRVSKVTGSSQYFGFTGETQHALRAGASLGAGDALETRSCDVWTELQLRDGASLTVAGHSTLRILNAEPGETRVKLLQGNLWLNSVESAAPERGVIETPIATVFSRDAQLNIQTTEGEMILRVNQGPARVIRIVDRSRVDIPAAHQVSVSLGSKAPLAAVPQPKPINHWSCDLAQVPEVILGRWLPLSGARWARLGAEPLLWPVENGDSVMLYAVALAAWKMSPRPVVLESGARFRFRGQTARRQTVRFGFSTQKMQGVFSGKFEVDVPTELLAAPGEPWEVELRLEDFRPLHPQLASTLDGLELTDVYALTIREDAGLEIHHIELLAP